MLTFVNRVPNVEDPVCVRAFWRVFCIGAGRFKNVQLRVAKNVSWVDVPRVGKQPTSYALLCVQWLDTFILSCVERMPNREIFHLPDSYTKEEIFMDYARQQVTASDSHVSYSYFCRLCKGTSSWSKFRGATDFQFVKIVKTLSEI